MIAKSAGKVPKWAQTAAMPPKSADFVIQTKQERDFSIVLCLDGVKVGTLARKAKDPKFKFRPRHFFFLLKY